MLKVFIALLIMVFTRRIYFNKAEAPLVNVGDNELQARLKRLINFYVSNGFPEDNIRNAFDDSPVRRYGQKGRLAFSILKQGDTIEIGYEYSGKGAIEFYVKDKGPGVPIEFQEAIFDKFVQLEKKKDGRIYSTGLGLTFCKLAIKAHKGKIGVESRNLSGSRFYFSIPAEVGRFKSYHESSHSR